METGNVGQACYWCYGVLKDTPQNRACTSSVAHLIMKHSKNSALEREVGKNGGEHEEPEVQQQSQRGKHTVHVMIKPREV